ncbi:hypothetical protein D7X33_13865 [Butyricicoccus sp. 1XD8-22]|nr:hypothetical protein D7X33_13865 [Butyricicoccus sp. 1XD8-22]
MSYFQPKNRAISILFAVHIRLPHPCKTGQLNAARFYMIPAPQEPRPARCPDGGPVHGADRKNAPSPPAGGGRESRGANRRHQMRPSGRAAVSLSGGARFSSAP